MQSGLFASKTYSRLSDVDEVAMCIYSESENVPLYAFIHRSLPNPLPYSCKSEQASAHIAHSSVTEICEDNIFEHIFCQHIKTLSVLMLCSRSNPPKNGNV